MKPPLMYSIGQIKTIKMHPLLTNPYEWQFVDKETNLLYPYYTEPSLEIIDYFDFSDKSVLELGMGASTIWWSKKAKSVVAVDDNPQWYNMVVEGLNEKNSHNVHAIFAEELQYYTLPLKTMGVFDLIIVDGSFRKECLELISKQNLSQDGMVILDNLEFMPEAIEIPLLRANEVHIFAQPKHHYWRTAIWHIRNFELVSDNHELNSFEQKKRRGML